MIVARWRLLRTWSYQRNELAREITKHDKNSTAPSAAAIAFRALSDQSNAYANSHRYETSYDRQFKNCLRELTKMRLLRDRSSQSATVHNSIDSSTFDADDQTKLQ